MSYELFMSIIPEIIAGICGFAIAKYTYSKGTPTNNLNIAFEKIYYPLFCLCKRNMNDSDVIRQAGIRLSQYYKYANNTTIKAYELANGEKEEKKKKYYKLLKDDIYDNYYRCRKRLGYLSPRVMSGYKFMSLDDKIAFWMFVSSMGGAFGMVLNDVLQVLEIESTFGVTITIVSIVLLSLFIVFYGAIKIFISIRVLLFNCMDKISTACKSFNK